MALTSSGTLAFSTIKDEFGGGSSNISLSEYYRDPEGVVSGNNTDVPSGGNSGPISVSDLYSAAFKAYVTYNVIGGGGGGGSGSHSGGCSGTGSSGSSSTLSGSGFTTVTASGGSGGVNCGGSGWSGSTSGANSPLGGGGGARATTDSGSGSNGTVAGAGGGGGNGNNRTFNDGTAGTGGSAGSQTTGSQYMAPATLTLTAGAGGAGHSGHSNGGNGDHGYVNVTVRAPNADGTWTDTKQSATQNSAGSSTLAVADTAYTG